MGTSVFCTSLEKYQVLVRTRTHAWMADEPTALEGDGLGPSPFELLLGSLGVCTTIAVAHYAGISRIPLAGLWVDVAGQEKPEDKKYYIKITLKVRGELNDQDIERLKRSAGRCPIHHLLAPGTVIETEMVVV